MVQKLVQKIVQKLVQWSNGPVHILPYAPNNCTETNFLWTFFLKNALEEIYPIITKSQIALFIGG